MKVTEAKYGRKFRLAEYESEEIVLTATLDEDEDAGEVLAELKSQVEAAHEGEETPKKKTNTKRGKKAEKEEEEDGEEESQEEGDEEESDEDGEESEEDDSEESEEESDEDGEDSEEDEEESSSGTVKKKAAKKTGGKKFKSKEAEYDRDSELHKKLAGEMLDEKFPKWRKDKAILAKAKKVSAKMQGKPFLNAEGEVVESFTKEYVKLMKAAK